MDAPGSRIGGMTGGIIDARIEIVCGNSPAGHRQFSGQSTMKEKSRLLYKAPSMPAAKSSTLVHGKAKQGRQIVVTIHQQIGLHEIGANVGCGLTIASKRAPINSH